MNTNILKFNGQSQMWACGEGFKGSKRRKMVTVKCLKGGKTVTKPCLDCRWFLERKSVSCHGESLWTVRVVLPSSRFTATAAIHSSPGDQAVC